MISAVSAGAGSGKLWGSLRTSYQARRHPWCMVLVKQRLVFVQA
jgi:hypothetical protein